MEKLRKQVGYEEFSAWERKLARGLARDRAQSLGRTDVDTDDLEQEFLLHIHIKRKSSKAATEAGKKAFLRKALHRRFLDLAKAEHREKRSIHGRMDSLDEEFESEDGDRMSLWETLPEDASSPQAATAEAREEVRIMVGGAAESLSEFQRGICRMIMDGLSVSEIARSLGKPWSTLKDEIARMRELLYDAGLKGVVEVREIPERRRP